jgi:hypothetical protein
MRSKYFIEMTDTFGGESNYSWVNRFIVESVSFMGAIRKVAKETGYSVHKVMDCGDFARYDAKGACICFFVNDIPDGQDGVDTLLSMYKVKEL